MAEEFKEEIVDAETVTEQGEGVDENPEKAEWYVVHTYSGYENKVLTDVTNIRDNNPKFSGRILDAKVPTQDVVEIKDGKAKNVSRKLFPGYVFIQMIMSNEVWYVIRNIRGVTGFVGPGSKAVPLTDEEIKKMGIYTETVSVDFEEGDEIEVIRGSWQGSRGIVQKIDLNKEMVKVTLDSFSLDLNLKDVRKVEF